MWRRGAAKRSGSVGQGDTYATRRSRTTEIPRSRVLELQLRSGYALAPLQLVPNVRNLPQTILGEIGQFHLAKDRTFLFCVDTTIQEGRGKEE